MKEKFLPLELGGVDIILRMQWLYLLGVTVVDWNNLSLTFSCHDKQICIKGDPSLTKSRVSLKNIIKSWGDHDEGYLTECRAVEVGGLIKAEFCEADENPTTDSVLILLDKHTNVFEWPKRLPPRRSIEHHIHLKKGTDPINVRPYRYAYHQKKKMEKLVSSRVIRPNTSPFSSLVLHVKKKDGS